MKVQLILLVCLLANFVFSTTVTGVPQLICGMETVSVSGDVSVATLMEITPSVSTVAVSPSNFTLSPSGSVNVTITCNQITPVTFTVYDLDNSVVITTFYSYCKGMIYIQNPISSIIRGNDFETSLYLFPTPTSVVDITVKVDNPIVVPGSDRLSFGVGQNIETELFYVPAGEVGPVNIYFESRSLRDYSGPNCQELVLSLDVLGTITSDIQAQTIGDGVYTNVTVTLHPPALDTVVVEIDASNIGVATPSSLTFRPGQDVATFRLLPKVGSSDTPLSITFTADYYDTLVEYIYIDGTIFTSTPSVIPTLGVEDLHIAILPGAQDTPVTIYTTSSSNVVVPSTITFPAGTSLVHFSLDALSAGSGYVTFYAPGYISQTDYFTITDLTCGDGEVVNEFGTECLQCPMFGNLVCSGNGFCTNSSIDSNSARCECYSIFNGGYCQAIYNEYYYNFYSSGVAISTAEIPGTLQVDFVIPSSIVSGDETGFLNLYPNNEFNATDYIANAVNPNTVQPSMSGFTTYTLSSGFGIELVYSDNTLISTLNTPILATFDFDPEIISQTVFLEMDLCYYNVSSAEWVPSTSICGSAYQLYSEDLLDLVVETYLCAPGQYNFFRFVPIPQFPAPEEPVYVYNDYVDYEQDYQFATTGLTGVQQQQVPPQPNLPVYEFDPSPPRNAYQEQDNSSSFTAPSFIAVLFVLFSILF